MTTRTVEVRLTANDASYASTIKRDAQLTKSFAESAKSTNQHLANMGNGTKQVTGFLGGYRSAAEQAATASRKHGVEMNNLAKAGQYVHDTLGLALGTMLGFTAAQGVVQGVTAAWHELVGSTIEFDRNMRNVQSITKESDGSLAKMEGTILGLSNTLPQTAGDLSAGLYDIASSGFQGAAGVQVLTAAATAASAGLSTTAVAARGITGVLNAYGESALHAADVSDVMFQTVNLGVITFDELASGIGDYIGTAAVLGVSFGETEAALAAMTLSGVSAAESGTSLNRVLTSLIMPSDSLGALFKSMGYESGVAAVKALGLHGTMELIRTSTGGTADSMAALFPEMRAMRGALALVAADGKNYARTQNGIANAHNVAGAAAKALAEQEKSLDYQMKVTGNNIRNAFVGIGAELAPDIAQGIGSMRGLADTAGDVAQVVGHELGPVLDDVGTILGDLGDVAGDVWHELEPYATFVLGAGFLTATTVLRGLSIALREVTGFARDNEVVIRLLAAALGAYLAVQAVQAAVGIARLGYELVYTSPALTHFTRFLTGLPAASRAAGGGVQGLTTALTGTVSGAGLAMGAFAVFTAAVVSGLTTIANHAENANKRVDAMVNRKYDTDSIMGLNKALDDMSRKRDAIAAKVKPINWMGNDAQGHGSGATDAIYEGGAAILGIETSRQRDIADSEAYTKKIDELAKKRNNTISNAQAAMTALGRKPNVDLRKLLGATDLSNLGPGYFAAVRPYINRVESVVANAKKAGFDLTQLGEKGKQARRDFVQSQKEMAKAAGFSGDQIAHAGQIDTEALTQMAQAAADAQKAVHDSFTKSADVVGEFTGKAFGSGKDDVNTDKIRKFYGDQLKVTNEFLGDYRIAVQRGYDPQLLARLLQAGPEAAGGTLKALVTNTTDSFVTQVNMAERELARLAAYAAEVQRLATRAIRQPTYDPAELDRAIAITQAKMELGAQASVESIAEKLKLTPEQVTAIAHTYDIPLPNLNLEVKLNDLSVSGALGSVAAKIGDFNGLLPINVDLNDPKDAQKWLTDTKRKLEDVPELKPILAEIRDPQQLLVFLLLLKGRIDDVPKNPTVNVHSTADTKALDDTIIKVRSIDGKTFRFSVIAGVHEDDQGRGTNRRDAVSGSGAYGLPEGIDFGKLANGSARGNLFEPHTGFVKHYGYGAVLDGRHQPKLYGRGAGMHAFNEPDAGGEALIPLANDSRRGRAVGLTADVAGRFGYGLVPAGRGSGHAMAGARGLNAGSGGPTALSLGGTSVRVDGNADTSTIDAMKRTLHQRDNRLIRKVRAAASGGQR